MSAVEQDSPSSGPPIGRSDVLYAGVVVAWTILALCVLTSWRPEELRFEPTIPVAGVLAQLPIAITLVLRRRWPNLTLGLMILGTGLLIVQVAVGSPQTLTGPSSTLIIPAAAPFTTCAAASWTRRPRLTWMLVLVLIVLAARPWAPYLSVATLATAFVGVPALLGLYAGARRRLVTALTERAERARREQSLLAGRARAEERARIAEEMHDVVTGRVRQMLQRAERLRATAPAPTTRNAAAELASTGGQALAELHELVGALRSGAATPSTAAGVETTTSTSDLRQLVAESASVGVPVELHTDGDPAQLSPTVARTTHRIVQEALTNVRKHARGARVRVEVRYAVDGVRVSVRNGPPPPPERGDPTLSSGGSGTGLLGLRQRVELVDGTFEARRGADGGFAVDAILPAYVPTQLGGSSGPSGAMS